MAWVYYVVSRVMQGVSQKRGQKGTSGGGTHVRLVGGEAVVDAGGEDDQVVLLEADAHPLVGGVADVKVARAAAHVADLLVLVQVLVKKALDLGLVDVAHGGRRDLDLVAVAVAAVGGQLVDVGNVGDAVVQDAEALQGVDVDLLAGVVGEALVALGGEGKGSQSLTLPSAKSSAHPPSSYVPAGCQTRRPSLWWLGCGRGVRWS